jgi:hypothetical protein
VRDENGAAVLAIDGGKVTMTNEKGSTGVTPYAVDMSADGKWAVIGNSGVSGMLGQQSRMLGDADVVTLVGTSKRPFRAVWQLSVPSSPVSRYRRTGATSSSIRWRAPISRPTIRAATRWEGSMPR